MVASERRHELPSSEFLSVVRQQGLPLREPRSLDPLLERIGSAHYVLLGEASHGTAEFYTWRAELTRRLIAEKGFSFLALEGDWPDCYQVNRYVRGLGEAGTAQEALRIFQRWPTWMWANAEFADLVEWLLTWNRGRPDAERVGVYGLDVYSLWDSLYQVLGYLQRVNPSALPAARRAYHCFEPFGEDGQAYARSMRWVPDTCEDEAVALLADLRKRAPLYESSGPEDYFVAEQNALVLKNAEAYYRTMIRGDRESWNVRDGHMAETLDRLMKHHGPDAKTIVWAHNTHLGDARYCDMAGDGMVNLGQLVRERVGEKDVVVAGFGTYEGHVIAGREWEAPMERIAVPPGRPGSWEDVLHRAGPDDKLLVFDPSRRSAEMDAWRDQRAIGVVYHPEYEHLGNYVPTVLPRRYDAFVFIDESEAVHPLFIGPRREHHVADTYPSGV